MHTRKALLALAGTRQAASGLWPGWDFDAHPVAMALPEGTLLWGHPRPPAEFQPFAPPAGCPLPGPLHLGPVRSDLANSTTEWGGVTVATALLDGAPDGDWAPRLLLHEAFHAFQRHLRPDSGVPFTQTPDYPEDDAVNNALARAENAALAAYMEGGLAAAECAAAVVALRRARHACIPAHWPEYEGACEWSEGGATLTEALAFPHPARADILRGLHACNRGGEGAAVRRFYHSGAAIGLLCSALLRDWRRGWLAPDATPLRLLQACVAEPGVAATADTLGRHGIAGLLAEEADATGERRAEDGRLLAALHPAVEIDTSRVPARVFVQNPTALRILGGGRRLHRGAVRQEGSGWIFDWPQGQNPVLEDLRQGRLVLRRPEGCSLPEGTGPVDLPFLRAQRAEVRVEGQSLRIRLLVLGA